MSRTQFASTITPPAPVLTSTTGNLSGGTYSVWLYCRNRAGVTLFSDRTEITIATGQGIDIYLTDTIKQTGSDYQYIGIVLGTNSDPTQGSVIATYPFDQTLPANYVLYEPDHVVLAGTVATSGELPTDVLHGMRRYIADEGVIKEYNLFETRWDIVYPQTFNPYVSDTQTPGGADIDLQEIPNAQDLIIPDYEGTGDPSDPVLFWIVNDGTVDISAGTRIRLSATSSSNGDLTAEDFAGLLEIEFLGYVDTTTAILDTEDMTVGGYIPYEGLNVNKLVLPKPLPPNYGCVIGVRADFENYALANAMLQGEIIQVYPYFAHYYSIYNPAGSFLGDHIEATGERRRVIPNGAGLNLLALSGTGTVKDFRFENIGEQEVFPLQANTANQKVVITNNGTCYIADTVPDTAALRAIISTVDGVGEATAVQTVTLNDTLLLEITLTNPSTIRADYPDAIAGITTPLNAQKIRVYANFSSWEYWDVPITGDATEVLTVGDTSGTAIASVEVPAVNFGLFTPQVTFNTTSGSSSFLSGGNYFYNIRVAYLYENTVTAISHSTTDGCINEELIPYGTLSSQVSAAVNYWGARVSNVANLQALTPAGGLTPYKTYLAGGEYYYYDPNSTRADGLFYLPMTSGEPGAIVRTKLPLFLSQNINWYISPSGDSEAAGDSNSTPTTWSEISQRLSKIDLNDYQVIVNFAITTTYSDRIVIPQVGNQKGNGKLLLQAEFSTNEPNFPILADGLEAKNLSCALEIRQFHITSPTQKCLELVNCSNIKLSAIALALGNTSAEAAFLDNCRGETDQFLGLRGNAKTFISLVNNSRIDGTVSNYSIDNGSVLTVAALQVTSNGIFLLGSAAITGSFTGKKFSIDRGFVQCNNNLSTAIASGSAGEILNPQIGHSKNVIQGRQNYSADTTSLAPNASTNLDFPLAKEFIVLKVSTSLKARVRGYTTAANRTADSNRDTSVAPTGEHGVIFDVETEGTAPNCSWTLFPKAIGANEETTPTTTIPFRITNLDTNSGVITVSVEAIALANI